jgi:Ca-activated chloride channel family protein
MDLLAIINSMDRLVTIRNSDHLVTINNKDHLAIINLRNRSALGTELMSTFKNKNIANKYISIFAVFFLLFGFLSKLAAQPLQQQKQTVRILFVFDSSFSMITKWNNNKKIDVATSLLMQMVDSLKRYSHVELALRVYGHQYHVPPQRCDDSKLEVPFAKNNHQQIKDVLGNIYPKGTTPIAYSLEQSGNDFPKGGNSRNFIILITDGMEECSGDPCAISYALQSNGITLKPFIIGVGLDANIVTNLDCIGKYYDAKTEDSFMDILNVVVTQILNPTSVQVNLLDTYDKAKETNVPFTLYDQNSGNMVYNYVHTMNDAGFPDTLYLDNNITYRIKVHTIPAVEKSNITITQGRHNIIAVKAPQGFLALKVMGNNAYGNNLKCIIRETGKTNTLHVMDFGFSEEFLVGEYDLEILSTPRINLKKIKIGQSATTNIEIEEPGMLTLVTGNPGYGAIYKLNGKDMEFVCTINESASQIVLPMQPGTYKAVFRLKGNVQTLQTRDKNFTIISGQNTTLNVKT